MLASSSETPAAPALAASLLYGIVLAPLQAAWGDFGALLTSEMAALPLRDSNDALTREFATRLGRVGS